MKITALRPQSGVYGRVSPGESIEATKSLGEKLLASPNWATPADAKKHFAKLRKKNADIARASKSGGAAALLVDQATSADA